MSLKERVEATAKNIEGKVQEAFGNLTGDLNAQVEGREKQIEANVLHTIEDVKDEVNHDRGLKDRAEATAKNIEGKMQESFGDLTGDPKAQIDGRVKQMEAKIHHTAQDVKDEFDNALE
jgi:uncharacterized protein YjbJ (UPF0337 family)